jgi:energy-coupling factor transporter ATP-binding protein EcfA2
MSSPSRLLDGVVDVAAATNPSMRPQLVAARARLAADVTIVVAGRRGAGKTTLVNALVGAEVGVPMYSADDQPVQLVSWREHAGPDWLQTTRVTAPYLEGRSLLELPEHAAGRSDILSMLSEWRPDVVVYVAPHQLRADEVELIGRAHREWRLGPPDVVVVLVDPATQAFAAESQERLVTLRRRMLADPHRPFAQVAVVDGSVDAVREALTSTERFVDARRAATELRSVEELAARSDDRAWSGRLMDDLERLALAPETHVLRERWALDECLSQRAQAPTDLVRDLVALTLVPPRPSSDDALAAVASRWLAEANRLPPRPAEVARIVVRTCQLRIATTAVSPEKVP